MRKINLIVLHCSATRETAEYTPEQLERDHRAQGFLTAGYNYYIRRSGKVVPMRPPELIPAHVKGFNRFSLGVCYEGGLDASGRPKDTRTEDQKAAIRMLLMVLLDKYPGCRICGHRDLSPDRNGDGWITPDEWLKACPCFNAEEEYGI
ncbi:N-acetylmuramoyl-L-alanine amidase [Parabacteroides gordonii]|jgi:N-acetylmuramoyl-L-alanine amidase|uniref:N-acetylmuramoyl-L-alanine amidase n=1 Tax=Parabacteroides gordonii TaxID=574930 RepID=UPI00241DF23D|nr:N-acetylmuramoyl-L-alanine amidase [Parabacteroides gordonii]